MAESLESLLARVSSNYDKRPGSFVYDSLAPMGAEFDYIKQALDTAVGKLLMENLSGIELEKRIEEVTGLTRKAGVRSIGNILFTGTGSVSIGDIVETPSGLQARMTEAKAIVGSGLVAAEAVVVGADGNVPANQFTAIPTTITGITAATNPEAFHGGVDMESDDALLQRYNRRIKEPPSSGNNSFYVDLATQIPGIDNARVFRAWAGGGTVKVVVISPDKRSPSASIVSQADVLIQANSTIGAMVTVVGATEIMISLAATLTLKSGGSLDNAIVQIRQAVSDYLRGLAFADTIVRANRIGEAILSAGDVLDYLGLTINGSTGNIELQQDQVPVIGAVNMTL